MAPLQVTHQAIWRLSGPIIISNISIPLVGAVDTAVVGHLSDPQLIGAIALGALIFSFLYWGFGFLKMGITGFVARYFGAGNTLRIQQTLLQFILLAVLLSLIIIVFRQPLTDFILYWINGSEQTEELASQYTLIRIWGAPATLLIYVFTGFLVGIHNTKGALYLHLVLNLTNIALDFLFVLVFDWQIQGVAWATLIAEYSALIFTLLLLRRHICAAFSQIRSKEVFTIEQLKTVFRSNGNIFIRSLLLVFCFAYFTAQGANYGTVILASGAILMHLYTIMGYTLDAFAHATEALCGSSYGAANKKLFRRALLLTTLWSGLGALLFSLAYLFFGHWIIALFSDSAEVLTTTKSYLIWAILLPLFSFWSFQLDGLFIGTSQTSKMRNTMIISTIGFLLMASLLQPLYQYHGLFLALLIFMVLRAVTLAYYYPHLENSLCVNQDD